MAPSDIFDTYVLQLLYFVLLRMRLIELRYLSTSNSSSRYVEHLVFGFAIYR